jgi:hypothetical protein
MLTDVLNYTPDASLNMIAFTGLVGFIMAIYQDVKEMTND